MNENGTDGMVKDAVEDFRKELMGLDEKELAKLLARHRKVSKKRKILHPGSRTKEGLTPEEQTQLLEAFRTYYKTSYFQVYNAQRTQVEQSAAALLNVYNGNVFPEMNITWGTYPTNLGHADFPGCFRCHDGNHKSSSGREITQDCNACHSLLAMDEADPKILHELYPNP